jgi:hypothetical protein
MCAPNSRPLRVCELIISVISGFNTDVECAGTIYHVQTEDKGAPHHVIMSLVYDKGTILASKRAAYDTATPEKALKEQLDKQHKLMCAAVKAGRVDDLRKMTASARNGAKQAKAAAPAETVVAEQAVTAPVVDVPASLPIPVITETPSAPPPPEPEHRVPNSSIIEPLVQDPAVEDDPFADLPIIELDGIEIVDEYAEIVPGAVEVVSELSGQARPTHNKLAIELLGDGKFRGGDRKTVNIFVTRGSDRKVVPSAPIMIKILGSAFRPVIFHARSDENGIARVHMQVPQFTAGRAALLVRAMADGEEVEVRRLVSPNS